MVGVDYQSNGGALIRMEVAFGAWTDSVAEQPATAGTTVTGAAGAGAPLFPPDASAPAPLAVHRWPFPCPRLAWQRLLWWWWAARRSP